MDDFWKFAIVFIVVGIPIIGGMSWGMVDSWMKHRRKLAEIQVKLTADKATPYAAQVERLEQRVRVLERIVTEKGHGLSEEIERLRIERLPEPARGDS